MQKREFPQFGPITAFVRAFTCYEEERVTIFQSLHNITPFVRRFDFLK